MGLYMERNLKPTVDSIKRSVCATKFKTDAKLKKKCHLIMDSHGEIMVNILVRRLDSQTFCCENGLCSRRPTYVTRMPPFAMPDDLMQAGQERPAWLNMAPAKAM